MTTENQPQPLFHEILAKLILERWTLCQPLGDNGEYYPTPNDSDDQLSELTELISSLPPPVRGEKLWSVANQRADCFDSRWASIIDENGKVIEDTSEALANKVVAAHNATLAKQQEDFKET